MTSTILFLFVTKSTVSQLLVFVSNHRGSLDEIIKQSKRIHFLHHLSEYFDWKTTGQNQYGIDVYLAHISKYKTDPRAD